MIKRTYLISYKDISSPYHALNSDVLSTYELTLKIVWFGFINTTKRTRIELKSYQSLQDTLRAWDDLIKKEVRL